MNPQQADISGRVAIVTGGGSGIGEAIARCLSAFGARVVVADIDGRSAEHAAQNVRVSGGQGLALTVDVRSQPDVERMVAATIQQFGSVDILVNNVGGTMRKAFLEMTPEEWQAMLDLNLLQVFRCTSVVAQRMIDSGTPGSIINLTTVEAYRAAPGYAPYAAAKAGVAQFTKTMALELAPWGIRVNSIAPDATDTPGIAEIRDTAELQQDTAAPPGHIPMGRRGVPEDFGGAAIFFASDLSRWVTGEVLHIGGGTRASSGWRRDARGYWNNGGPPQMYSGKSLGS